jgi:hypothetical protein
MSNWTADFKRGFWIGLGVGASILVVSLATGILRKV